jgi:hypothetical protein
MTVASRSIVELGAAVFEIVHAPIFISDRSPADHVVQSKVSGSVVPVGGSKKAAPPALTFFTLPNHLMEELWLESIPDLVELGPNGASAQAGGWAGLTTLSFMLETVDARFASGAKAILQIGVVASPDACANEILRPDASAGHSSARVCAWVNLDEQPQRVSVAPRVAKTCEAIIEIGGGEGCVWDTMDLRVSACGETVTVPAVRLLIFA